MRTILFLLLFGAVSLAIGESSDFSSEDRDLYIRNEVREWASIIHGGPDAMTVYRHWSSKGYSDSEICEELIDRILQPDIPAGQKEGYITGNASFAALGLFRGNAAVEKAVISACDAKLYDGPLLNPSGFLQQAIAYFGSDELIDEYITFFKNEYGLDKYSLRHFEETVASRPRHKRESTGETAKTSETTRIVGKEGDVSSSSAKFKPDAWRPERVNGPGKAGSRRGGGAPVETGPGSSPAWWSLGLGVAGLLASCWGYFRKKRIWLIAGIILVAGGGGLYFFLPHSATSPSSPDGIPEIPPGGNMEPQGTNPARFKPDAWRPERPNFPAPAPRERTPYDILSDEIRQIMAPFYAADPHDRAGNQKAKEAAAMKLLDILEKGMPKGCRPDNWTGVVGQIIGCQSYSPVCMDRAIEMIGKWIGNPQRTEPETLTALREMMNWRQKDAVDPGTTELKRFERIAEMQEAMFHKASTESKGELLFLMESAAKLVNRPGSQMPEKIVDDKRLLSLMVTMRQGVSDDPSANGRIMGAMRDRVVSTPESFPAFEEIAKDILTSSKIDVMGTMQGLEMIAKVSRAGRPLPSWMDDAGIARQITALHQKAAPFGKDSLAIQRTGFVSDRAMMVIRERMMVDPASVAKNYGEVLMFVASDANAGRDSQMQAVRTAVKSGLISREEARAKFGTDP